MSSTPFKDLFSAQASSYATYRPTYPNQLYDYLSGLTKEHTLAWDCATGNGQAAAALAKHYEQVIATDASQEQLNQAEKALNITYQKAPAEQSPLQNKTADLITVAQAAHWFNLPAFYKEADRVLKPGGVLALWCYKRTKIAESIDTVIKHFTHHTLANYWAPEIRLVNDAYQSIPFPYHEIAPPKFKVEADWTLDQLMGYLYSWSATQKYIAQHGQNPVEEVRALLEPRWGEAGSTRKVGFKLYFRIGQKPF